MNLLIRVIFSFPVRLLVVIGLLVGTGLWFASGLSFCKYRSPENRSQRTLDQLTKLVAHRDPEAAAEMARWRTESDRLALTATAMERYRFQGTDGLIHLAALRKANTDVYETKLVRLALDPELVPQAERESFLTAHTLPLEQGQILNSYSSPVVKSAIRKSNDEYMETLSAASQSPDLWEQVRDNPMMVFLLRNIKDRELLLFYQTQKEWLDDVLFVTLAQWEESEQEQSPSEFVQGVLALAQKNHPYFHDALNGILSEKDNTETVASTISAVFSLFSSYDEAIIHCVREGHIPLEEILTVFFAHRDYLARHENDSPVDLANRMIQIRRTMPEIWRQAPEHLLVFDLAEDVPNQADSLVRKYGDKDIAVFLYSKYADLLLPAARAVDRYGELAVYILNRYESSETFRSALARRELDVRIIPYTAKFGDQGLEKIAENSAWLDKYFDEAGNPKTKQWWTTLPVGSAVDVAKSWAMGEPTEWSELGWAALDVADIALLALTCGTSAPATVAKSSATSVTKVGARELAKRATVTIGKTGANKAVRSVARKTVVEGIESSGRNQMKKSLLRNAVIRTSRTQSIRLVPVVSKTGGIRYICAASSGLASAARDSVLRLFNGARSLKSAWSSVSPVRRHMIYRSLLYAGVSMTLICHTVPELIQILPELAEQFGTFAANVITQGGKAMGATLNSCLNELLGDVVDARWMPYVAFGVIAMILTLFSFVMTRSLWPRKKRSAFVG